MLVNVADIWSFWNHDHEKKYNLALKFSRDKADLGLKKFEIKAPEEDQNTSEGSPPVENGDPEEK